MKSLVSELEGLEAEEESNRFPRITTFRKIRGYLKSLLVEAPLANDARTFNIERLCQRMGMPSISKKTLL